MKIAFVGPIAVNAAPRIQALLDEQHETLYLKTPADVQRHSEELSSVDALVGWPLDREVVSLARGVRLIQVVGAGVDGVPFDLVPDGAVVANTYHHETAIAEHVLMAMLVLTRQPADYDRRLRQGEWFDSCIWGEWPRLDVLAGRAVLLIGIGRIAVEVAARCKAFRMLVVGISRRPRAVPHVDRVEPYTSLQAELGKADFVVVCCALRPDTRGLIGPSEFRCMKRTACLINVARGPIVDEQALYEALRDGLIAGAAIDVWYCYPQDPNQRAYPSRYPFHELPNVLMTPHVAGWSQTTLEGRIRDVAENLNRLAAGKPLRNVVYPTPMESPPLAR